MVGFKWWVLNGGFRWCMPDLAISYISSITNCFKSKMNKKTLFIYLFILYIFHQFLTILFCICVNLII